MTSTIVEFEEFSPVLHGVPVGLFDGRFEFDAETEQIAWIELDGWPENRTERKRPTVTLNPYESEAHMGSFVRWLRLELQRKYASEISERSGRILDDGSDPYADWRPSKAQMGL